MKLDPVPKDVQEGKIGADKEAEAENGRQKQENIAWLRRRKKKQGVKKASKMPRIKKVKEHRKGGQVVTTGNTRWPHPARNRETETNKRGQRKHVQENSRHNSSNDQ